MTEFLLGAAVFVLADVAVGLFRIFHRRRAADCMMAAQLIGTGGVAVLLLLAVANETPAIVDVALMLGLATGDETIQIAAAFYAVHHVLVKGGLFLALGVATTSRMPGGGWLVMVPAVLLALGLAGLPFTGGQLAKFAVKDAFGDGVMGVLAQLSAVNSAALMFHFLYCLRRSPADTAEGSPSAGGVAPWLITAIAALVVPWALFPTVDGSSRADVLTLAELWSALWPILAGGTLFAGLRAWHAHLPRVPEGDFLAVFECCAPVARNLGAALERVDGALRQWPAAGACAALLVLSMALLLATP